MAIPRRNALLWTLGLFALWVLLSGKLDAAHLGMGILCAAGVVAASRRLLGLPPSLGPGVTGPLTAGLAGRLVVYAAWLLVQIVVGSLQVAWVILHPRLPVDPQLLRLRADLPHPLARLTLATSITLTPGTVTLDLEGDEILVHALTEASARSLGSGDGGSDMLCRLRRVFAAGEGAGP